MIERRVSLKPVGGGCWQVWFKSKMGHSPIGRVCQTPAGWTYYSFPMVNVERGPTRTKAGAVREVIKSHSSYVGYKLGYTTKYRGKVSSTPKRSKATRSTAKRTKSKRRTLRRLRRLTARRRGWGIMRSGASSRPSVVPLLHARVLKPVAPGVTKSVPVKNLGWFFRKARETVISRFDMWQANDGWEMFADFEDGTKFQTHYASLEVFKAVMKRQRSLRGYTVNVHHADGSRTSIQL